MSQATLAAEESFVADVTVAPATAVSSDRRPMLLAIGIFATLSVAGAIASHGFLEADSCTHYLYARGALANPALIVNVWGRPVCTALYAIPAHLGGRLGVRFTSLMAAVGIALIARLVAAGQGWRLPGLALICTLAQPLVFLHSFSELTELPFALLLALAFWAYQRKRWFWLSAVAGLLPLSRPEGFGFVVLAGAALVCHRRAWWLPVLAIPLLGWDLSGWVLYGRPGPWWHWLIDNWPYAETSLYDRGSLLHFVGLLPAVTSPLIFPATLVGICLCLAPMRPSVAAAWNALTSSNHRRRCEVLIAVLPLIILVGHSLLYWRGKMASNGEVRYMLVVAVFWGLLAGRGWAATFDRMRWPYPTRWLGVAALLPILLNGFWNVVPIRSQPDWIEADKIATWYVTANQEQLYPHLIVAHPGIVYELDRRNVVGHLIDWRRPTIDKAIPGCLMIWDPIYGVYNSDASRSIPQAQLSGLLTHGWHAVQVPWGGTLSAGGWRVFATSAAGQ